MSDFTVLSQKDYNDLLARLAEAEEILSHAYKNPTWFESTVLALEAEEYFNRWNNKR